MLSRAGQKERSDCCQHCVSVQVLENRVVITPAFNAYHNITLSWYTPEVLIWIVAAPPSQAACSTDKGITPTMNAQMPVSRQEDVANPLGPSTHKCTRQAVTCAVNLLSFKW